MKRIAFCMCVLLWLGGYGSAAELRVPEDHATIQAALDAAANGDVVVLAPGEYRGEGNRRLNFHGKAVTLTGVDPDDPEIVANTLIDAEGWMNCFEFSEGESLDTVVRGLTMTGAYGFSGGALFMMNASSPTIDRCVITGNQASLGGGGAYIAADCSPAFLNCIFTKNLGGSGGGAVYAYSSSPTFYDCVFVDNRGQLGGAFQLQSVHEVWMLNCTVADNMATGPTGQASALYATGMGNLYLENSLFWGNASENGDPSVIHVEQQGEFGSAWIAYCNIENFDQSVTVDLSSQIDLGDGIIDADPLFVAAGYVDEDTGEYVLGDYHLMDDSPCVNAADPLYTAFEGETDMDGQRRIAGERMDIGADEVPMPIPARMRACPQTLRLWLPGRYILVAAKIEDSEYDITDTDVATILLNETVAPARVYKLDHVLAMKFHRQDVRQMIAANQSRLDVEITGLLDDGTKWKGSDSIRIEHRPWWYKYFKRMFKQCRYRCGR